MPGFQCRCPLCQLTDSQAVALKALDALGPGAHAEQHAKLDQPGTGALAQGAPKQQILSMIKGGVAGACRCFGALLTGSLPGRPALRHICRPPPPPPWHLGPWPLDDPTAKIREDSSLRSARFKDLLDKFRIGSSPRFEATLGQVPD